MTHIPKAIPGAFLIDREAPRVRRAQRFSIVRPGVTPAEQRAKNLMRKYQNDSPSLWRYERGGWELDVS